MSALQIRMLHQLWQGRAREADQLKERIELLRIENSPRQLGDGTHFIGQVTAHAKQGSLPDHVLATLTGSQLTSLLVGCHKPSERAERSLQRLLRRSGASRGFLYLIGDHGPELVAQIGAGDARSELAGAVHEFIHVELEDLAMRTRSLESDDPPAAASSERCAGFHLVLLSHQTSEGFAVTGAAALRVAIGETFVHPGTLAAHLSRLTFDAGDVTPILGE